MSVVLLLEHMWMEEGGRIHGMYCLGGGVRVCFRPKINCPDKALPFLRSSGCPQNSVTGRNSYFHVTFFKIKINANKSLMSQASVLNKDEIS